MEPEDENPEPVIASDVEAANELHGQGWQADSNRSDGEALALHEI
jgi:hypothetical protein